MRTDTHYDTLHIPIERSPDLPADRPETDVSVQDPATVIDHSAFGAVTEADDGVVAAHEVYAKLIGLWAPGMIEAAHDLGLYPHLTGAAITGVEAAALLHTDRTATRVLLDGLHAYGIVERTLDNGQYRYRLHDRYLPVLLEGGAYSLVGKMHHDRAVAWPAWRDLADTVRHGNTDAQGSASRNQISEGQYASLVGGISFWAPPAVDALRGGLGDLGWDLDAPADVLDVGCGTGLYSHLLLRASPTWTATGLEAPRIAAIARGQAHTLGVSDRFSCRVTDFLTEDWGRDHDLVVFANIFHLQPPQTAQELLARAAGAVRPGGCVCVIDQIVEDAETIDTPQDRFAALFAVSMLSTGGGDAYLLSDYERWTHSAGLHPRALLKTPMHRVLLATAEPA